MQSVARVKTTADSHVVAVWLQPRRDCDSIVRRMGVALKSHGDRIAVGSHSCRKCNYRITYAKSQPNGINPSQKQFRKFFLFATAFEKFVQNFYITLSELQSPIKEDVRQMNSLRVLCLCV